MNKFKIVLICIGILVILYASYFGYRFTTGKQEILETNTDAIGVIDLQILKLYAKGNNLIAVKKLFNYYSFSLNREEGKANYWLLKGANAGDANLQYILGSNLLNSDQLSKALFWLTKSAESNYVDAQLMLAKIYEEGGGVRKNIELAVDWYKKAAHNKEPIAMINLSKLYLEDTKNKDNIMLAYTWAILANKVAHAGSDTQIKAMKLEEHLKGLITKQYRRPDEELQKAKEMAPTLIK